MRTKDFYRIPGICLGVHRASLSPKRGTRLYRKVGFLGIFLENHRIFAKDVRDFYGMMRPLDFSVKRDFQQSYTTFRGRKFPSRRSS